VTPPVLELRDLVVRAGGRTILTVPRMALAGGSTTAVLERLGIGALAERPAHRLSGGEAQRVSLARAFAVNPRVLLLDEPFGALDAPTRGELLADLREALAATGTAALLVTHDRHEAAALGDRVAVLHAGELRQEGPAQQVLDHPADADCARILGFDNVLPGRLLGVAADQVALAPDACRLTGAGLTLAARLVRAIPLGPVWRLVFEVEGRTVLANAPEPPPAGLRPGDRVELRVDPAAIRAL
jgi:ABC-type Fe3+/spermidine/putrescine transport system ATPase subunit